MVGAIAEPSNPPRRTKWLHQGHFTWPPIRDGVVHLSATQLAMLLDGLEWTRVSPKPVKQPAVVG